MPPFPDSRLLAPLGLACVLGIAACGDSDTTTGTTSTSSSSSDSSSSSGTLCTPGSTEACYSGPSGTEDVGSCHGGTQTCNADGTALSACEGEVVPSAENCVTSADEDCNGVVAACTGDLLASADVTVSNPSTSGAEVYGLAFDADGSLVASGIFNGTMDFGAGPLTSAGGNDGFLVSFDPEAAPLGGARFGSALGEEALGIRALRDGVFALYGRAGDVAVLGPSVIGEAPFHLFAAEVGADLGFDKARVLTGTSAAYGEQIAASSAGRIAIVGTFSAGTIDLGAGAVTAAGSDAFVAVYQDDLETLAWQRILTASGTLTLDNVEVDELGNVFVSGYGPAALDIDGLSLDSASRFVLGLDPTGAAVFLIPDTNAEALASDHLGGVTWSGSGLHHVDAAGVETLTYPTRLTPFARDDFGNFVGVRNDGTNTYSLVKIDPNGGDVFARPIDLTVVRTLAIAKDGRIAVSGRSDSSALQSTIEWFAP